MKTLKFASNLVPLVLSGEKTATWRMFDDKDLTVGDELSLLDQMTGKEFAQAKITAVEEKTFGKIDAADLVGHEHYTSRAEMLKVYQSYYGDHVTEDTPVKMIDFELVKIISMHLPDHPLFDELKKLALPAGEYAVFGSGPLWVRGIRESNDIDIIARGAAWEWAKVNGKMGIKEGSGLDYASFFDGSIEAYHVWYPGEWDIDQLIDTAEMIDDVPFVRLEHVIAWKKIMGREKDAKDLALIEAYRSKNKE